jgi:hypothetical protein
MLFKADLLAKILSGQKTQTRRLGPKQYRVGSIQPISSSYTKPAGYIKITKKYRQPLCCISESEAKKEGFNSTDEFREAWKQINGNYNPDQVVTFYEFLLVTENIKGQTKIAMKAAKENE